MSEREERSVNGEVVGGGLDDGVGRHGDADEGKLVVRKRVVEEVVVNQCFSRRVELLVLRQYFLAKFADVSEQVRPALCHFTLINLNYNP